MSKRQFISLVVLIGAAWFAGAVQAQTEILAPEPIGPLPPTPVPVETSVVASSEYLPGSPMMGPGIVAEQQPQTSNSMLWQQYQALQMGDVGGEGEACSACGASGYDRCGCNTELFPWTPGPGSIDQWCVGPRWAVDVNGLFWFREDADWNSVIAATGAGPALVDQFDHGPGARLFVTGYNESGFGIQVGYEGINHWNANLAYATDALVVGETRKFTYESSLNSIEINFLPNVPYVWKWYSGFRYVELSEDFLDSTTETKAVPAPATPAGSSTFTDLGVNRLLKNQLFGFQLGARRDAWNWGSRVSFETFANAGVYCNKFRREDVNVTVTTTITGDDTATTDVTELSNTSSTFVTATRHNLAVASFLGEAGLTAEFRLNQVAALRAGYQVLFLDGVGEGLAASFTPGVNDTSLLYHGLQFGFEYRR